MKILQLRFKNLNSLVGEWSIDFTQPEYQAEGIFSITGPTGSGKTTILDALCLALYGRTPRLPKIVKSTNEIMSRQTGECFAEVVFETLSGHYRCFWGQHRSRKSPSGDLQNPKHEISDANTGDVLETKVRSVAEKIEQVTGMDFDRFTRSMLLAQGGFSAFLQASPDERAPILEQITGTEIYSRISVKVHDVRAIERKALELLQSKLSGVSILTENEEQSLRSEMAKKQEQEIELNQEVNLQTQRKIWLNTIARLELDRQSLTERQIAHQGRLSEFSPFRLKLTMANKALELSGEYAALLTLRDEQANVLRNLKVYQEKLPEKINQLIEKKSVLSEKEAVLLASKIEQKNTLEIIKKVRLIDLELQQKNKILKLSSDNILKISDGIEKTKHRHVKNKKDLKMKQDILKSESLIEEKTRADEGLIASFSGIQQRLLSLQSLAKKIDEAKESLIRNDDEFNHKLSTSKNIKALLFKEQCLLKPLEERRKEIESSLALLLSGKTLPKCRGSLQKYQDRGRVFHEVLSIFSALEEKKTVLSKLDETVKRLKSESETLETKIESSQEMVDGLSREQGLLEKNFRQAKVINNYEKERLSLQDGKACPLCGSDDHPFAYGNVPNLDDEEAQLDSIRNKLKSKEKDLSNAKSSLERVNTGLIFSDEKKAELEASINRGVTALSDGLSHLSLTDNRFEMIVKQQAIEERELSRLSEVVTKSEEYETAIEAIDKNIERSKSKVSELNDNAQRAEHEKELEKRKLEQTKKTLDERLLESKKEKAKLLDELGCYQIFDFKIEKIEELVSSLTTRREQRISLNDRLTMLEHEVSNLDVQLSLQSTRLLEQEEELKMKKAENESLSADVEIIRQSRFDLFSDNVPDDEENRLSSVVIELEEGVDIAKESLNAKKEGVANLRYNIKQLEADNIKRKSELRKNEEEFNLRLMPLGFKDENKYKEAILPEGDRKKLVDEEREIDAEKNRTDGLHQEIERQLLAEKTRALTDKDITVVNERLEQLMNDQKQLQQTLGGMKKEISVNENRKIEQVEQRGAIEKQQKTYQQWDVLHQLIGSADGKKYRNFAQGLTFDMMINHANRQLMKMTDRYLLVRDENSPLSLNVIDNYQAAEVRSTKNLSGGEGFIVSLSLALGLSQMASKNVRVDSLFLDEGFGTLDEESLDIALDVLSNLQQDGKLIGVISHVSSLKSRINTQLQVKTVAGGRSKISGPGCLEIAS